MSLLSVTLPIRTINGYNVPINMGAVKSLAGRSVWAVPCIAIYPR